MTTTVTGPRSPYDLGPADLAGLAAASDEPAYRANQVANWLDRRHVWDPAAMTDLPAGEVVEQVARVWAALPGLRPHERVPDHLTNVVFMGMGEPFTNPAATW